MAEILYGIDVSSHQPRDLSGIIAQHKPEHVIVRVYLDHEQPPLSHTADQVASSRAAGCSVGGYVWGYRSVDPVLTIDRTIQACAEIGLVLPICWIDCETYNSDPGPDAAWLRAAVDRAALYEMPCGLYSAKWWVDGHFPGGQNAYREFTHLPQWIAEYDGIDDIEVFTPFSGITTLAAKQWAVRLPGDTYELDRTIIRPEYTALPDTPVDPCAEIKTENDRLRAGIDDAIAMLTQLKGG